jgi:3-oxoadipate enol-lactonase
MSAFTLDVNGTKLHVMTDGAEAAPCVVLIHSLGTNANLYDGQVPALAKDFRVLRYDMRGHGRSSAPPGPYSMDTLVDDLLGLLARFKIARAHLVGISLGALTAIAAAQRGTAQIASFAFCDSRADMSADFVKAIDDRNRLVREQGMEAIAKPVVTRWLTPTTMAQKPDVAEKVSQMVRTTPVEGFIACTEAIKGNKILERLSAVKVPSLFLAGDQDPGLPTEVMHRMQIQVPRSEFSVLVGASHLSNLDQQHSFNHVLLAFLKKHAAAA